MKRIAFCLLWAFLALPLHAQEYDYVAGAGGAAACSYTQKDYLLSPTTSGDGRVRYSNDFYADAASFTSTASYTAKRIKVIMKKVGSPAGTLTVSICTNDATPDPDFPNVCTSVATKAEADLTTDYATYTFDIADYSITTGTRYWIKYTSDRANSSANYVNVNYDSNFARTEINQVINSLGATYSSDATAHAVFELDSCE